MKHTHAILLILLFLAGACQHKTPEQKPLSIIYETDMGNDIDDALAADILYKYHDAGKINLLGIMLNKEGVHQPEYIDILNTWYHHTEIPIGIIRLNNVTPDPDDYAAKVCKLTDDQGEPLYKRTIQDYTTLPDAHVLYRKLLAQQPNHSVTIVSVGFSTNLARLLDTTADEYSPLSGKELVAQKVSRLITMAGGIPDSSFYEYNIKEDIPSAQKVFHEWPTPLVTSPFEVGEAIRYPAESIENDFKWAEHHPVVDGYVNYMPMPYSRQTWDLTAAIYALGGDSLFTTSPAGNITVTDKGATLFTKNPQGNRYYMSVDSLQAANVLREFLRIIPSPYK